MKAKKKKSLFTKTFLFTIFLSLINLSLAQDFTPQYSADNPKVNQQAIYRISLTKKNSNLNSFASGTKIKTFFPSSLTINTANGAAMTICRRFFTETRTTSAISNCLYDSTNKMVSFSLTSTTQITFDFTYEIGLIKNPATAITVSGFRVKIENSAGSLLYDINALQSLVYIQPGDIIGQTVVAASYKVADKTQYTFTFKISNPIPAGGKVDITFPMNEINIPNGLQSSDFSVTIYGKSITPTVILKNTRVISLTELFTTQLAVDPTQNLIIAINGVTNPISMVQTASFKIETLDTGNVYIDRAATGMNVQMILPADLFPNSTTPSTLAPFVRSGTFIGFDFTYSVPNDVLSYLEVTFPSEVFIDTTNIYCFKQNGFSYDQDLCETVSSNVVRITDAFNGQNIIFSIGYARNPSSNKPTSTFAVDIYNTAGSKICSKSTDLTYSAQPDVIYVDAATRGVTVLGVTDGNSIVINFTPTNYIAEDEYIKVRVPYDQMQLVSSSALFCQIKKVSDIAYTTADCNLDTSTDKDYFIVTLASPCTGQCDDLQEYFIMLSGVRNPYWIVDPQTRSIEISSMTSDKLWARDQVLTDIYLTPALTEGIITEKSLIKTGYIVNKATSLDLTFTTVNPIQASGIIRLFFPEKSFYIFDTQSIQCINSLTSVALTCTASLFVDPMRGIEYIDITDYCPTICESSAQIKIGISNLKNKGYVKPIANSFTIRTYTKEYHKIDLGTINDAAGLDLEPAQFTSLILSSPITPIYTGVVDTYIFKVISENGITIANGGSLNIQLPADVSFVSNLGSCQAQASTTDLLCQLNTQIKTMIIQNPDTSNTFANSEITVSISGQIRNPQSTRPSQPVQFKTTLYDPEAKQEYLIDQDLNSIAIKADTPSPMKDVTIMRDNFVINEASNYTFTFSIFNPIPKGSFIVVQMPKTQVVIISSTQVSFQTIDTKASIAVQSIEGFDDSTLNHVKVTLKEWCSNLAKECPAGTMLSLNMFGGKNYKTTKFPKFQFIIQTQTNDGYQIDQASDITAAPLLSAGPFTSVSLSQSSQMVGEDTVLTITAVFNNEITSGSKGKLHVKFPLGLYYISIDSDSTPICTVSGSTTSCTTTTQENIMGTSYSEVIIIMDCDVQSCANSQQKVLTISKLRNRFSSKGFSGQLFFSMLDDEDTVFDSSSLQLSATSLPQSLTPNINGNFQSITRSVKSVSTHTDIAIQVQLQVRTQKNSLIQIHIPQDQFEKVPQTSIRCSDIESGLSIDCAYLTPITNYHIVQFIENCSQNMQYCPDLTVIGVVISGFKNRYNTKPGSIKVYYKTFTSDLFQIEESQNNLLPTDDLETIQGIVRDDYILTPPYVGKITNLQINIDIQNKILKDDFISLNFTNSLFKVPTTTRLDSTLSTNKETTLLTAPISQQSTGGYINFIAVRCPKDFIKAGQIVRLSIKGLLNIEEDRPLTADILMSAYTSDGGNKYSISSGTLSITGVDFLKPAPFRSMVVRRDKQDLQAPIALSVNFQFDVPVLASSYILMKLPKSQVILQDTVITSCSLKDISIDCSITDDTDYNILTTSKIICLADKDCPLNTTQTLKINGFMNPYYKMLDMKPFLVKIISSNEYPILSTEETFLNATPEFRVAQLYSYKVVQSQSFDTSENTSYKFTFNLPYRIDSSYKLLINFPVGSVMVDPTNTLTCAKDEIKNYDCKILKQVDLYIQIVSIENFCLLDDCGADSSHSLTLYNILNSDFNRTRDGQIVVQTTTSLYQITGEGIFQEASLPLFNPADVINLTVTRDSNKLGQQSLDLTIDVKLRHEIPDKSTLLYFIPTQQVIMPSISKFSCSAMSLFSSPRAIDCIVLSRNETFILLQVEEWCNGNCPLNTTLSLKIRDTQNPLTLEANDPTYSFGVLIQDTQGFARMQRRSGVIASPPLYGVNITSIFIQRDTNVLGASGNLTVLFQIASRVVIQSNVTLQIPINTTFMQNQDKLECYSFRNKAWQVVNCISQTEKNISVFGQNPIHNVTITNFCSKDEPCLPATLYQIKISVQNTRSNYPLLQLNATGSKFNLTLQQQILEIGRAFIQNNLTYYTPSTVIADVQAFNPQSKLKCDQTGDLCSLNFDITTSNPFGNQTNNYLEILLPLQLQLQRTSSSCEAQLIQPSYNLTCRLFTNTIQVNIPAKFQLSTIISYSLQIQVTVTNVRLPMSTEQTSPIYIRTVENYAANQNLIIDEIQEELRFASKYGKEFSSIKVIRKETQTGLPTDLEFEIKMDNEITRDAIIQIDIPESQAIVGNDNAKCKLIGGFFGSVNLKCEIVTDQSVLLYGVCGNSGCSMGETIKFQLTKDFISNPTIIDSESESINMRAYYLKNSIEYLIQQSTQGLVITPDLTIDENSNGNNTNNGSNGENNSTNPNNTKEGLVMSNITFLSNVLSDLQAVSFKVAYRVGTFTKDQVRVQFVNISFNLDSFYKVEASINNIKAAIRTNLTNNEYNDQILDCIYIDCDPIICKGKQALDIKIEGFRNPFFKPAVVDRVYLPRIVFAELTAYPDTINYRTIQPIFEFLMKMVQNPLKSSQTKFSNYSTGQSNNELQLLFTLDNRPRIDKNADVVLKLPTNYSIIAKPVCYNIFDNTTLQCSLSKGELVVSGYFSQQTFVTSRRILQSSSQVSSITTVAIAIGNITNPKSASQNTALTVSVESGNKVYAIDNQTFNLQTFNLSTNTCIDSNCSECSFDSPNICTKCLTPSARPLLQDGQCRANCSSGYFEFDAKCYKCAYGCKECQTYNLCTKCQSGQVLIDGKCFDKVNIFDQSLVCPDGTVKNDTYGCIQQGYCTDSKCLVCGVDQNFCLKCSNEYATLNGQCLSSCPFGYTKNSRGFCEKCDSNCLTCNGTAKKCSSCRKNTSINIVLDKSTWTCGTTCSKSSLPNSNNNFVCDACSSECASCSGNLTNCTSCSYNRQTYQRVFYHDGKCISKCPFGMTGNPSTHECHFSDSESMAAGPIFLIVTGAISLFLTLLSFVITKRNDDSIGIILALFTQIDSINRVVILILLWKDENILSYCFTGMNVLANLVLGMYFTRVVTEAVCKQIKTIPQQNFLFQAIVILSQISGTNTMRLITSNFLKLQSFNAVSLTTLPYFFKPLEQMSLLAGIFHFIQLLVSISLLASFRVETTVFGFAINGLILNLIIGTLIGVKYKQYKELIKQYVPVTKIRQLESEQRTNNNIGGAIELQPIRKNE